MTREEFKQLFDLNFDAVRNYLYYRSGDAELATDLAQETFLKIWEKQLGTGHKNVRALLFKIASDMFVTQFRRQKALTAVRLKLNPEVAGQSPEEQMVFNELKEKYEVALAGMPENQRSVFMMSRMDRMKYHEIAGCLGLSQKAVEKRMNLALAFLKEKLEMK
jgi:RNA polymerase sigma-70 factor (ECF subfamily)